MRTRGHGLGVMPPVFLEDRRGREARSDRDYALLADYFLRTAEALCDAEEEAMRGQASPPLHRERGRWAGHHSRSYQWAAMEFVARRVASVWADAHGGAVKTWRQRLTRARAFLDQEDGVIDWEDDARGCLWLTDEGFRLAYGCEFDELAARLFRYRHAQGDDRLFQTSDREVASRLLKVPAVRVPPQRLPPVRRFPRSV